MSRVAWILVLLIGACGGGDERPGCPPLHVERDGSCQRYGVASCADGFVPDGSGGCSVVLPAARCEGASIATPGDASCRFIGIDRCPDGFDLEDGACTPAIPKSCEEDERVSLATRACVPIAPCAPGKYAATTAPAIHVDAAFSGGASDGSEARPFTRLADALAVVDGARKTILLADGKYEITARLDRPAEIIGRCPSTVSIYGGSAYTPTLTIAADVTLRAVTVHGTSIGVRVEGSSARIVESKVSDTGAEGVYVVGGGARLELERSVVARTKLVGVAAQGATVIIADSEVRGATVSGTGGGIGVGLLSLGGTPASAEVRRSVLSDNERYGVYAQASKLIVDGSLVRRTGLEKRLAGGGIYAIAGARAPEVTVTGTVVADSTGYGIAALDGTLAVDRVVVTGNSATKTAAAAALYVGVDPKTRRPGHATIERVVLQRSEDNGLFVAGGAADVSSLVVREITPASLTQTGVGVRVGLGAVGTVRAAVMVRDALVERTHSGGLSVSAGDATFERVVVRDVAPDPVELRYGAGLVVFVADRAQRPDVTLRRALIERVHDAGVISFGAKVTVEGTAIRDVVQRANGKYGHGLHFSVDPTSNLAAEGVVRGTVVTGAFEAAINLYKSSAIVEDCTLLGTRPGDGEVGFGDAITVAGISSVDIGSGGAWMPARLVVRRTRIDGSARAALSVFEAEADVEGLLATCSALDIDVETLPHPDPHPPNLVDRGGNVCGCGALAWCRAASSNLAPVELD